jgi:uncharacterized caspase-like protein
MSGSGIPNERTNMRPRLHAAWNRARWRSVCDWARLGMMLLVATCVLSAQAGQDRRLAVVIGNGAYASAPLSNPVGDARAIAANLRTLGFDVVLKENLDLPGMLDAARYLYLKAKEYDVRLFYYAGHGVQVRGRNYLVPTNVTSLGEDEVASKTLDASELLERLGAVRAGFNMVILDACRNNPFVGATIMTADGRSVRVRGAGSGRAGLAPVEPALGSMVAYSTAPGQVAADGTKGSNGLYTRYLLANMMTPGLPVEQLFKRVRNAVAKETHGEQVPWESSSMVGDFCFRTGPSGTCSGGADIRPLESVAGPSSEGR